MNYIQTSMNWREYTSHHTRHFSKRQHLPGDCFSPLIEDHTPKYIDFNSCDSALCRICTEWRGGTAQANSYYLVQAIWDIVPQVIYIYIIVGGVRDVVLVVVVVRVVVVVLPLEILNLHSLGVQPNAKLGPNKPMQHAPPRTRKPRHFHDCIVVTK